MVMMEIVQGVCIFCTENDSVLSDENKIDFFKIIKINFFSNNRFNFSEFSKLFNKLSICLLCAYKVQCCSNTRDALKKGDTNKSKRNQDKCCSLCYKTENVTTGTAQLRKKANEFTKYIKNGSNINIKYICLSCSYSVSVWDSIVTSIWNILNDESADSEKENVAKTNAKNKNKNLDTSETENKIETTRSTRLRTRPGTENGNKSKSENSAKVKEEKTKTTRKRSTGDTHNDVTPKKRRISARVNSESESSPEKNLKRTGRKNETTRHGIEESVSESTPVQTKKSRQSEDTSTPKILRTPNIRALRTNSVKKNKRILAHDSKGMLDKKLKHLNTVNRETRKKNMHLSYNAVTDQRIMFEIPYIPCTPHDVDSLIVKKPNTISCDENESSNENSLSSKKRMDTKKGSKNKIKAKRLTTSNETTPRRASIRQTRSKNKNQIKEIIVIDISSTDDEVNGETPSQSYRRSDRRRKPTPKALAESKKEKLSPSIKKATKIQFKCTVCNEYFPTLHKMTLHKVKHHKPSSPASELSTRNTENMETNEDSDKNTEDSDKNAEDSDKNAEDSDKNTEDNNTETEEEFDKRDNVSSADIEENNAEPSDPNNSNINDETNKTDENTEVTENNVEEEEASIEDEDIGKSDKELDTDENVTEEISEAQNIDKNEAEVDTETTEENDTVEITDKQASDEKSTNNDNMDTDTIDNGEEKDNDKMNDDKDTSNIDDANEEIEDNKLTSNDENSNEKSDAETVILNDNNVEQITNDIIEDICAITDVTDIQDDEETSIDDTVLEENANIAELTEENAELTEENAELTEENAELTVENAELTEENADLMQSSTIVQDEDNSTEKLNTKQNEENQEDDSKQPEEEVKIQEETSIPAEESISEISSSSNLNDVIDITEDETVIIADNKNVPTVDITALPEEDPEMESLKITSQNSSCSNISSIGKTETETTVTDESNQKSNGVITVENNFQLKDPMEDFAIVENLLENMGA